MKFEFSENVPSFDVSSIQGASASGSAAPWLDKAGDTQRDPVIPSQRGLQFSDATSRVNIAAEQPVTGPDSTDKLRGDFMDSPSDRFADFKAGPGWQEPTERVNVVKNLQPSSEPVAETPAHGEAVHLDVAVMDKDSIQFSEDRAAERDAMGFDAGPDWRDPTSRVDAVRDVYVATDKPVDGRGSMEDLRGDFSDSPADGRAVSSRLEALVDGAEQSGMDMSMDV